MYEVYDIENCEVVFEGSYEECKDIRDIQPLYYSLRKSGSIYSDLDNEQLDWVQRHLK